MIRYKDFSTNYLITGFKKKESNLIKKKCFDLIVDLICVRYLKVSKTVLWYDRRTVSFCPVRPRLAQWPSIFISPTLSPLSIISSISCNSKQEPKFYRVGLKFQRIAFCFYEWYHHHHHHHHRRRRRHRRRLVLVLILILRRWIEQTMNTFAYRYTRSSVSDS